MDDERQRWESEWRFLSAHDGLFVVVCLRRPSACAALTRSKSVLRHVTSMPATPVEESLEPCWRHYISLLHGLVWYIFACSARVGCAVETGLGTVQHCAGPPPRLTCCRSGCARNFSAVTLPRRWRLSLLHAPAKCHPKTPTQQSADDTEGHRDDTMSADAIDPQLRDASHNTAPSRGAIVPLPWRGSHADEQNDGDSDGEAHDKRRKLNLWKCKPCREARKKVKIHLGEAWRRTKLIHGPIVLPGRSCVASEMPAVHPTSSAPAGMLRARVEYSDARQESFQTRSSLEAPVRAREVGLETNRK